METKKNKDDWGIAGDFMHSIHMLYFVMQKRLENALIADKNLSFSQFLVLAPLSDTSCVGHITQKELAECLSLTEATISRHIRALVEVGYISKVHVGTNKKSFSLSVTESGRKAFEREKIIVLKEIESSFSGISKEKQQEITTLFNKVFIDLHGNKCLA